MVLIKSETNSFELQTKHLFKMSSQKFSNESSLEVNR